MVCAKARTEAVDVASGAHFDAHPTRCGSRSRRSISIRATRAPLVARRSRDVQLPQKFFHRNYKTKEKIMGEFISQIIRGTPIWVWVILIALIALGVQQLRTRVVKRFTVLIAPVVFLFVGLASSGRSSMAFAMWAVTLLAVAAFTFFVWKPTAGARYDAAQDHLHLPGSVIPMLIMLAIFLLNYIINVALAIHPAWRGELVWQLVPAVVLGALSGVFIGRAATLFRMNCVTSTAVAA
jgi:hypothetical protein